MWTVPWEMCRFSLQDEYKNAGLRTCIFAHTGTQMKYTGKLAGARFTAGEEETSLPDQMKILWKD